MKIMPALALFLTLLSGPVFASPQAPAVPDELAAFLKQQLPAYRLVIPQDYVPAISASDRGLPFIRADFDRDGQPDYAVLLVQRQTRETRVYFLLRRQAGFHTDLLLSWPALSPGASVRTPMSFKKPGEEGLTGVDRNELQKIPNWEHLPSKEVIRLRNAKAAYYLSVPAIIVWTGVGSPDLRGDEMGLNYCSRTWFYQAGRLKAFDACD